MNTPLGDGKPSPSNLRVVVTWLALLAAYLLLATSTSLWDRDEPRFARATVEMVESGDFLVPTFNGDLRPDKPAGIYWLMSVGYRVLGHTELAFRLPSVLGILGAAGLTFLIGRRLFNARVGYRAMLFYGSALMVGYMATASTSDGTMNGLITLSLWCFVEIVYGKKRLPLLILMAIALGWAQLVKGPVGVVVPLISMLTMGVLGARSGAFKLPVATWLGIGAAVLVSFGAFIAWGIPANIASEGELLKQGLGKHVVERATSPMENHGGSGIVGYLAWLPFYVPVVLIAFMPWVMHLPGGLSALSGKRLGDAKQRAILWGWIAPTFLLMTLVVTRLPHYVLPIFPGLALLCAAAIDTMHTERLAERDRKWLRYGRFLLAPLLLGGAAGAIAAGWVIPDAGAMKVPGMLLGLVLLGFGAVEVLHLRKGRSEDASRVALMGVVPALLITCFWMLPSVEALVKPSRPLARAVRMAGVTADTPVVLCGYNEGSLIFYLNRQIDHPVGFLSTTEQVVEWARRPEPGVMVIDTESMEVYGLTLEDIGLEQLYAAPTVKYSDNSEPVKLYALRRGG